MKANQDPSPAGLDQEARRDARPGRPLLKWVLLAAAVVVAVFLAGYLPRRTRAQAAESAAAQAASELPVVHVAKVKRAPGVSKLLLPGVLTPLTEAYIYARATGYVRKRYADIGDHVRAGQKLADIEAPDLDLQVTQAEATLALSERSLAQSQRALEQGQAQMDLAKVTWDRYRPLVAQGVVSKQEGDQASASYRAALANVQALEANIQAQQENIRANRANLQRLVALQQFEHVQAPFTGVITARNVDIGALISGSGSTLGISSAPAGGTQNIGAVGNAGSATANVNSAIGSAGAPGGPTPGSANGEMFRMAQTEVLRVLVDVPEESAPAIHPGQRATLTLPAFPGRTYPGTIARTANALDANTHTLLTEVDARNPGELLPGMYAQVQMEDRRKDAPFLVPGSAIIMRADGAELAVLLDGQNGAKRIHVQPVTIGRDYGPVTEITSGLQGWEYIVTTPGDNAVEGTLVRAAAAPQAEQEGGPRPAGSSQATGGVTRSSQPPPTGQQKPAQGDNRNTK